MSHFQNLKVIALISGGKDSLYSILHCLRNGYEVVALGNLHPPPVKLAEAKATVCEGIDDEEGDDMDSFMYQTIGHSIVPLYEEALGIPLYRRAIRGRAVNAEREYSSANFGATEKGGEEDETESLFYLLRDIMREHPTANAVSAGAILSTYQRTRIENVAGRLGLTPLAWLWMYPYLPPPTERAHDPSSAVTGLLDDMAAAGCEARIIKVASAGLDSADVLWGDLAGRDGRVRRTLVRTMGRLLTEGVEVAVLGEGGEYESLALDGPGFLWKKRIVVGETRTVTGEGGVASLKFKRVGCVEKEDRARDGVELSHIRRPGLFEPEFYALVDEFLKLWASRENKAAEVQGVDIPHSPDITGARWSLCISESRGDNAWYISNCCSPEDGPDAVRQMEGITRKLQSMLRSKDAESDDIVFSTVLLRSMSDFGRVNRVYASLFTKPNPPARVAVACGAALPEGVNVAVSIIIDEGPQRRRNGLHVQSRSYWAPANIGPYSQAISVPLKKDTSLVSDGGLVYIAGQIPLDPSTMDLYTTKRSGICSHADHAALSLQHLWRIGRAMDVDWWLGGIAFLSGNDNISAKAKMAADVWKMANTEPTMDSDDEEDGGFDAWDLKYGRQYDAGKSNKIEQRPLPRFDVLGLNGASGSSIPPFFAVQVDELPRGAEIEWQGLGARSCDVKIAHEDAGDVWIAHTQGSGFGSFMYIGIKSLKGIDVQQSLRDALGLAKEKRMSSHGQMTTVIYTPYPILDAVGLGQVVPCRSVRDSDGKELLAGITVHARP